MGNEIRVLLRFVLISESDGSIGPDGMEKFCMDLGIEPENVSQNLSLHCVLTLYGHCVISIGFGLTLFCSAVKKRRRPVP